ncbi:MAG: acetate/propionate family kinase [Nanoarchaeota archaeon]
MDKKILVFNVGSSSIKYSLFENSNLLESGEYEKLKSNENYKKAVQNIFKKFEDKKIDIIAHRVVHGGELKKTSRITREVKDKIKEFSEFAPLHNPKQLIVIKMCEKYNKPQYAVFDTMFFENLPDIAKTYAIPKEITRKYNIKRYGFPGLSAKSVSKYLKGKTIVCHLGSGSSISAIKDGKAIDTTMGLTPLEGIMMGTRSGSIDPGIILLLQKRGYNAENILTNKSGLKGLTGFEDFRDIRAKMNKNKDCKLAYDLLIYQITKTIGSYLAALGGLNNLVFTAKIGENVPKLREDVCKNLQFIGLNLDKNRNNKNEEIISSNNSKVKVYVRKDNEERIIIEEVLKILK